MNFVKLIDERKEEVFVNLDNVKSYKESFYGSAKEGMAGTELRMNDGTIQFVISTADYIHSFTTPKINPNM